MQSSPRIDELRQKFHENPRRYFAPLANEYRKAGDPEQAIAICRAHLAQQPAHMSGHVVYGQALYDAHRIEEAREVFQLALALDPENVIVLRHLGDIARQRGDVQEARSWYSRALDGDPHDAEIAAYLAELTEPLVSHGAEPEAPPAIPSESEAVVEAPADAPMEAEESPYLETEEQPEAPSVEAESEAPPPPVERQSRLTPTGEGFPILTRTLAELYLQQGHIEAALDIYRQLAEHEPDDGDIRARIAALSFDQQVGIIRAREDATTPEAASEPEEGSAEDELAMEFEESPAVADDAASVERESFETPGSDTLWDTADFWGGGFFEDTEAEDEIFGLSDDALSVAAQREARTPAPEPEQLKTVPESEPDDDATEVQSAEMAAEGGQSELASQMEEPEGPIESEAAIVEFISANLAAAAYFENPEPAEDESPYAPSEIQVDVEPEAEADAEIAEAATRELTVREFFATLGSMRPPFASQDEEMQTAADTEPDASPSSTGEPSAAEEALGFADDAFASLFAGAPVSAEDSRAATALSSAMAHGAPFSTPSTPSGSRRAAPSPPREASAQPGQESEEDIRRFREWLDGLAES